MAENKLEKFNRRVNAASAVGGPLKIKVLLNATSIYKDATAKQVYRGDLNFHPRPLTYSLF